MGGHPTYGRQIGHPQLCQQPNTPGVLATGSVRRSGAGGSRVSYGGMDVLWTMGDQLLTASLATTKPLNSGLNPLAHLPKPCSRCRRRGTATLFLKTDGSVWEDRGANSYLSQDSAWTSPISLYHMFDPTRDRCSCRMASRAAATIFFWGADHPKLRELGGIAGQVGGWGANNISVDGRSPPQCHRAYHGTVQRATIG